jgi:hypothetical protein
MTYACIHFVTSHVVPICKAHQVHQTQLLYICYATLNSLPVTTNQSVQQIQQFVQQIKFTQAQSYDCSACANFEVNQSAMQMKAVDIVRMCPLGTNQIVSIRKTDASQ